MGADAPHKSSVLFVILLAVFISISVAITLYFIQFLSDSPSGGSIKRMETAFDAGEPDKALAELNMLDNQERGTSESMLWYGKSWYLKAYKEYRDSSWRHYGIDSDDWFKGDAVEESVHFLKRAMEDEDTEVEATFYLALIYMHKGWFERSESKFKHLFKLEQTHREGILNYAVLKTRQRKFDQAIKILEKGVELYPEFSEYYKNLFWIYVEHLDGEFEGLVDYGKAISYGDHYLKSANQGDVGIIRVRGEMRDLLARFPELKDDSLELVKKDDPVFIPRKRK